MNKRNFGIRIVSSVLASKQVAYTTALAASFAAALMMVGRNSGSVAFGLVLVISTFLLLLALAQRFGQTKYFWSSVEFAFLLSGLVAATSGLASYLQSEHDKALSRLVDSVKETYVSVVNVGDKLYFRCSGRVPVPTNDPQDPCERAGHFVRQIQDERDRPSSVATGLGNRWDLNVCGTPMPQGVDEGTWGQFCSSLRELSQRQAQVRELETRRPTGVLISILSGRPLWFSLLLSAALFGAKCAKFVYDLRARVERSK